MPKIYPDDSIDSLNVPTVRRLVLPSDILRQGQNAGLLDGGRTIREIDGSDTPVGDIFNQTDLYVNGGGRMPDDEELTVLAASLDDNVNRIHAGAPFITLTRFIGWKIRPYRNNVPMENLLEDVNGFRWNIKTGKFTPFIPPEEGEIFTFQAIDDLPAPVTMPVLGSGSNINNIIVDNGIVFLTTFVNTRVRVTRNNILQSFVTDFSWDNEYAKLTLNVNPEIDEEFYIEAY